MYVFLWVLRQRRFQKSVKLIESLKRCQADEAPSSNNWRGMIWMSREKISFSVLSRRDYGHTWNRPTVKVFKRGGRELGCGDLLRKGTPATNPIELNFTGMSRINPKLSYALWLAYSPLLDLFALWHLVPSTFCSSVALALYKYLWRFDSLVFSTSVRSIVGCSTLLAI